MWQYKVSRTRIPSLLPLFILVVYKKQRILETCIPNHVPGKRRKKKDDPIIAYDASSHLGSHHARDGHGGNASGCLLTPTTTWTTRHECEQVLNIISWMGTTRLVTTCTHLSVLSPSSSGTVHIVSVSQVHLQMAWNLNRVSCLNFWIPHRVCPLQKYQESSGSL